MDEILTIEKIISFLKTDLRVAFCWPLSINATRWQKIVNNIFRVFCWVNGLLLSIALMYTLSRERDMILIMKVGCELSAFLQIPVQITLFTLQSDDFQVRYVICFSSVCLIYHDVIIYIFTYLYFHTQTAHVSKKQLKNRLQNVLLSFRHLAFWPFCAKVI